MTLGVLHDALTPGLTIIAMTHCTADHPDTGVLWHTQEITADPNCNLQTDQARKHNKNLHPNIVEP